MNLSDKPLSNLRVLDMTHAAAGPFATMFLADLGAEVIKIEKPQAGDGTRSMGEPIEALGPRESDYYVSLNRNKQGLVIDMATSAGADLVRKLASKCDIVVENFRPGVTERLGLGFEDLRKLRPHLIYASISAFGQDGPWAKRPANDIILQSVSGLMGITGERGGGPVRIGAPIADFSSGLFLLSGILAAVHARDRHPEGQRVDVSMLEASLNMMANYIPSVASLGRTIPRIGRGHAQIVPYQAFLCSDDKYVMVGAFTRAFWQNLCEALQRTEWLTDPRFRSNPARLANRDTLVPMLETLFREKASTQWVDILTEADVPNSTVMELHEAVESEQVLYQKSIQTVGRDGQSIRMARCPIRGAQWGPDEGATPAPEMGRDTQEVLRSVLGLNDVEIQTLTDKKIVAVSPPSATQMETPA
jgi:crotonobetainyl-CoA:carnitine CoA-transferase CaiB-like acyl-CoA transferase